MGGNTNDASDPAQFSALEPAVVSNSAQSDDVNLEQIVQHTCDEQVIPLVEEAARVEIRLVETGRVRVSTHTETVEQILRGSLRSDMVAVTRVPVNRTLTESEAAPVVRTEGGVTIVPILEEILVVEKRLVLREEVLIRRTTSGQNVEVPVTLRRQRAVVERMSPEGHVTEQHPETETEK